MRAIRGAWVWFTARWRNASALGRVLLAIALPIGAVIVVGVALPYEAIGRVDQADRIPEPVRWGVAALAFLVFVGLVGSISGGSSLTTPIGGASQSDDDTAVSSSPTATERSTSTSTAPVPATAAASAAAPEERADALGDLVDEDGTRARGPAYVDLVLISGTWQDETLVLRMDLAHAPPEEDPVETEISYGFFLDTDQDGDPNYQTLVSNIELGGEFEATLMPVSDSGTGEASTLTDWSLADERIEIRLSAGSMGNPGGVSIAAFSVWTFYPPSGAFDEVTDEAPDVIWPDDGAEWLEIGPAQ